MLALSSSQFDPSQTSRPRAARRPESASTVTAETDPELVALFCRLTRTASSASRPSRPAVELRMSLQRPDVVSSVLAPRGFLAFATQDLLLEGGQRIRAGIVPTLARPASASR
jgi:hypothetical protein